MEISIEVWLSVSGVYEKRIIAGGVPVHGVHPHFHQIPATALSPTVSAISSDVELEGEEPVGRVHWLSCN